MNDEVMGEIIKGRPQIMGTVANESPPFIGNLGVQPEAIKFLTRNCYFVETDTIRIQCLKSLDGRIKVRKIFFGPVNSLPERRFLASPVI